MHVLTLTADDIEQLMHKLVLRTLYHSIESRVRHNCDLIVEFVVKGWLIQKSSMRGSGDAGKLRTKKTTRGLAVTFARSSPYIIYLSSHLFQVFQAISFVDDTAFLLHSPQKHERT